MPRVYLDSCIVIYLVEAAPEISAAIQRALAGESFSAAPRVHVTDLTRLECRVHPLRKGKAEVLKRFDRFFSSRDVETVVLSPSVFDLATELRARQGLKTPDAIHMSAALHARCEEFWTNDRRLPRELANRIKARILP